MLSDNFLPLTNSELCAIDSDLSEDAFRFSDDSEFLDDSEPFDNDAELLDVSELSGTENDDDDSGI